MPTLKESLLQQLDDALECFKELQFDVFGELVEQDVKFSEYAHSALAAVERAVGTDTYRANLAREHVSAIISNINFERTRVECHQLAGLVNSVRNEVDAGYLESTQVLVHADMFSNLLEQAEYLLSENYKDSAAVLGGGVLEGHLRNLCDKNGIPYTQPDGRPKQASVMNVDLHKEKIYSGNQHKEVTAWQGIRNSAAHGKFDEYDAHQVKNMLSGIRGFINRYPA